MEKKIEMKDEQRGLSAELSEDELNNVSGGGCGGGNKKPEEFACPSCGTYCKPLSMVSDGLGMATEHYQCAYCKKKFDVIYVDDGYSIVEK